MFRDLRARILIITTKEINIIATAAIPPTTIKTVLVVPAPLTSSSKCKNYTNGKSTKMYPIERILYKLNHCIT